MKPVSPDITLLDSVESIQKEEWGQLTCSGFPFSEYEFLRSLEKSGVLGAENGWIPSYITLRDGKQLEAVSGLYTKTNSYGEYIFDWAWAQAYHQHGIDYYPKLVAATPFTPATGPKLLIRPGTDQSAAASVLIRAAKQQMERQDCSSLHYLFITEKEIPWFEKERFLIRHSFQYHWENRDYGCFDDFLQALKPKKRKQIIRERTQLKSTGIRIKIVTGDDLGPEHANLFYGYYLNTIRKMEAIPYLNADFFRIIFEHMRDRVLLILAEDKDETIAGALYFKGGGNLYGRYWGAVRDVRNLHFELCYYRPIEWAIANNIRLYEAGAQGEHKLARGFLPRLTYSAHLIGHPAFSAAISDFILQEQQGIRRCFDELAGHTPYLDGI